MPPAAANDESVVFEGNAGSGGCKTVDRQEGASHGNLARQEDLSADVKDDGPIALRHRIAKASWA
jgi:hypothetical protein